MKIHYNQCPLCGHPEIITTIECRDYLVSGESYELCRCNGCYLEFTQDVPDETETEKYYESESYIPHSDSGKSLSDKIYYTIREVMLKRKKSLVTRATHKKIGRILDYGSGTGHFASVMKKAGWEVTGIEVSKKTRKYSSEKFGLNVFSPDMINSIPSGSFDCITMWHVLEHLHKPVELMAEIKRLLAPDGTAIIALPNNISFDSIHYRHFWAAYDVPRHLWHFNPVSFISFAARSGFEVLSVKRLPFDVFYISFLSEKYKRSHFPFIKGIIKGKLFYLLSLFDKTRSSSLIYVLRPLKSA